VSPSTLTEPTLQPVRRRRAAVVGWQRWLLVLLSAGASFAVYVQLLGVLPDLNSAEPSHAGEVFPWVKLLTREALRQQDAADEVRYVVFLLDLFIFYGLTLVAVAGRRSLALEATAACAGAAFLVLQVAAPTMLSTDLYSYVLYGRVWALYQGDPYTTIPHYYTDPYEPLSYWKTDPSFYGPLWTLLSAELAMIGGERIGLTVLLFRGLTIVAALLAGAFLWAALRRAAPARAAQGLVFFLWNPLLVLETALSGHNDILMATFLLLGLLLHLHGRRVLAVAALMVSALVKFATVPVLALYILLVLRGLPNWRARSAYVATATASIALTIFIILGLARAGPQVLAVGALGSGPERYMNSLHGLIFDRLRIWLGESPQSVKAPVDYQRWWVESIRPTELWASIRPLTGRLARANRDNPFLVMAPQEGDWLWVHDPVSGQQGYVRNRDVRKIGPPAMVDSDPVLAQMAAGAASSPTVQRANTIIRLLSWALFGAFWLVAAWRARDLRSFLVWSVAVTLALYWFAASWFWPWYVVWALALAALVPGSGVAQLTVLLSAAALTLYAAFGFDIGPYTWIHTYRPLLVFIPPLVLFALGHLGWRMLRTLRSSETTAATLGPRLSPAARPRAAE
jgi:hypothetical protein